MFPKEAWNLGTPKSVTFYVAGQSVTVQADRSLPLFPKFKARGQGVETATGPSQEQALAQAEKIGAMAEKNGVTARIERNQPAAPKPLDNPPRG